MKKLYFIVISIGVIVFGYWIITSLPPFLSKVLTATSNVIRESSFSSTGSFAFKSTPERPKLLKQMLYINNDFMKNSSTKKEDVAIKNLYKLEKFFPNFKYYYIAKLKVTNILFTELEPLYTATSSLSDEKLNEYFNNNTKYLSEKWGINDFDSFSNLVYTIKEMNGKKVISYELEDSYYYIQDLNLVYFRIILNLEDESRIYLNVKVDIFGSSDSQTSPVVHFLGSLGGIS